MLIDFPVIIKVNSKQLGFQDQIDLFGQKCSRIFNSSSYVKVQWRVCCCGTAYLPKECYDELFLQLPQCFQYKNNQEKMKISFSWVFQQKCPRHQIHTETIHYLRQNQRSSMTISSLKPSKTKKLVSTEEETYKLLTPDT